MIVMQRWTTKYFFLITATLISTYLVAFTWLRAPSTTSNESIDRASPLQETAVECDTFDLLDPTSACFVTPSKYAYATILTGFNGADSEKYFTAVRLLTYQLVHDPDTRARNGIRFAVLVTKDVPQHKREILKQDGAVVLAVDSLTREWIHPKWARWNDVMAKLNLWTLTDYEKIVFMDADTVILHRLDGIFADSATTFQQTAPPRSNPDENEAPAPFPDRYMIAGIHDRWVEENLLPDPATGLLYATDNYLNAGFLVLAPSPDMFEYYLALLDQPDRFDLTYPEQILLNYAHRTDGRMPWRNLGAYWNAMTSFNRPFLGDVRSLHHKWWDKLRDRTVNEFVSETMGKMIALHNMTRDVRDEIH
jgi:alpha-N-acetylglucosamine transferase